MLYSFSHLKGEFNALFTGSNPPDEQVLPSVRNDLALVRGALTLLSAQGYYQLFHSDSSHEDEQLTDELYKKLDQFSSSTLCSWDGSSPGSSGYGDIQLLETSKGLGLAVATAGSSLSGAYTIYVLPAGAIS